MQSILSVLGTLDNVNGSSKQNTEVMIKLTSELKELSECLDITNFTDGSNEIQRDYAQTARALLLRLWQMLFSCRDRLEKHTVAFVDILVKYYLSVLLMVGLLCVRNGIILH